MRTTIAILLLSALSVFGDVIDPTNLVTMTPGVTLGVRGGIPIRTNLALQLEVSGAPYNADKTGATDCSAAFNQAIADVQSNGVIHISNGVYFAPSINAATKGYFTLRGSGSNTIIVGKIQLGSDANGGTTSYVITNGGNRLTTSCQLLSLSKNNDGVYMAVGDEVAVSGFIPDTNWLFQYESVGSDPNEVRILKQSVLILSTNMANNTVTFTPPLVWDFSMPQYGTNSGLMQAVNAVGNPNQSPVHNGYVGLENFTITGSNSPSIQTTSAQLIKMDDVSDCWVMSNNCLTANAYQIAMSGCMFCEVAHNLISFAKNTGSDNAGLLHGSGSGNFIYDNDFVNGLQPAIEFNNGTACTVFANYFTNNASDDFHIHNAHPAFNYYAENVGDSVNFDGYFGSASDFFLFRNRLNSGFLPVRLDRWSCRISLIGNVLGSSQFAYTNLFGDTNTAGFCIFLLGFPNIGNQQWIGTAPPQMFNWPQHFELYGTLTNGATTLTHDQVGVTNLTGNDFSWFDQANFVTNNFALKFQDGVNTNVYHSGHTNANGYPPVRAFLPGTTSNLTLVQSDLSAGTAFVTVSNGWTVYATGTQAYQQLQISNIASDIIIGNYTYFDNAIQWGTNTPSALIKDYVFTNGPPVWWTNYGTHQWPAIDPFNNGIVGTIPAQDRFNNTLGSGNGIVIITNITKMTVGKMIIGPSPAKPSPPVNTGLPSIIWM